MLPANSHIFSRCQKRCQFHKNINTDHVIYVYSILYMYIQYHMIYIHIYIYVYIQFLVQPYNNVDEVIKALKDKVVDGAILDMYAAATRKDLFEDGDIQLNRQVEYPSGYGIVLSGKMKHSTHMITEYYKSKTSELVQLIQNKTDVVTQVRDA